MQQNGEDVLDGVVTVTEKILPDELLVTGGGEVDEFAFTEGGDQQSGMAQLLVWASVWLAMMQILLKQLSGIAFASMGGWSGG